VKNNLGKVSNIFEIAIKSPIFLRIPKSCPFSMWKIIYCW